MTQAPPSGDDEIAEALGPAASLFAGGYTILVRTCHERGLTGLLGTHLERVYLQAESIRDTRVIESLLSIALHHCDNQYCYLLHSAWLLDQQVSVDEVVGILQLLEVPQGITDRKKWSMVLRCTYFASLDRHTSASNVGLVRQLVTPAEYRDYVHILALAGFLRTVLQCYAEEIDVHRAPVLTHGPHAADIQQLLSLSEERIARRRAPEAEGSRELVSLCMFCKDLRTEKDHWVPIELCIPLLPPDTIFSHGMCPECYQREFGDDAD